MIVSKAMALLASAPLLVLLAAACVPLAAVLGLELADGDAPLDAPVAVAPKVIHDAAMPAPPPAAFSMPPLQTFGEIAARPLFSRSRRPAAPGDGKGADGNRPGALVLNGTILTGADKIALLAAPASDRMTPLREGDVLAGWTLVAISAEKVVIRNGEAEQEVFLSDTLKRHDSAARGQPRQRQAQQGSAPQRLQKQPLPAPAPQQPAAAEKAGEPPADESHAERHKGLDALLKEKQNPAATRP